MALPRAPLQQAGEVMGSAIIPQFGSVQICDEFAAAAATRVKAQCPNDADVILAMLGLEATDGEA